MILEMNKDQEVQAKNLNGAFFVSFTKCSQIKKKAL